jgi:NADH:ubiquinone oxidoreductase subunit E
VIINEDYHEQMNPEKLDRLMDELRTQGQAHA